MSDNILNIDLDTSLRIEIRNQRPIELEDLTLSLLAFNHQFHLFVESETEPDSPISTQLFIKEVRSGSIIVDLVTHGASIAPLIWEGGSLHQWTKTIESIFHWLQGKLNSPPKELKKQDLQDWNKVLEPVAKDNGAQLNVNVKDGNVNIYQISVGSSDANAMQNRIAKQLEDLDLPNENLHRRKVMYWYQAKFDAGSDTGNRAKIDDISGRALKVIFENNLIKEEMLHPQVNFERPWQDLAYVVDVEVQTVQGEPKVYKVLRYYPEETFDPRAV